MSFMKPHLILEFTRRDLTERYSGSVLGVLWAFIWPLVNILIFTLVFSEVLGSRLPPVISSSTYSYAIYLVSGLLPWMAFQGTIARATTVFLDKSHIIKKIHVPLGSLPLFLVLSETVTYTISMAFFSAFLLIINAPISPLACLVPFIFVVQQIFAYGLGLLFGILSVFYRDLKEIVGVMLQIWFWFTPIVYLQDLLPASAKWIVSLNPAIIFVGAYHDIILLGKSPDYNALIWLTIFAHGILTVAYIAVRKLEMEVRDTL